MLVLRSIASCSEYTLCPVHLADLLGLDGSFPQVQYCFFLVKTPSCSFQVAPGSLAGPFSFEAVVLVGWAYTLRVVWAGW